MSVEYIFSITGVFTVAQMENQRGRRNQTLLQFWLWWITILVLCLAFLWRGNHSWTMQIVRSSSLSRCWVALKCFCLATMNLPFCNCSVWFCVQGKLWDWKPVKTVQLHTTKGAALLKTLLAVWGHLHVRWCLRFMADWAPSLLQTVQFGHGRYATLHDWFHVFQWYVALHHMNWHLVENYADLENRFLHVFAYVVPATKASAKWKRFLFLENQPLKAATFCLMVRQLYLQGTSEKSTRHGDHIWLAICIASAFHGSTKLDLAHASSPPWRNPFQRQLDLMFHLAP